MRAVLLSRGMLSPKLQKQRTSRRLSARISTTFVEVPHKSYSVSRCTVGSASSKSATFIKQTQFIVKMSDLKPRSEPPSTHSPRCRLLILAQRACAWSNKQRGMWSLTWTLYRGLLRVNASNEPLRHRILFNTHLCATVEDWRVYKWARNNKEQLRLSVTLHFPEVPRTQPSLSRGRPDRPLNSLWPSPASHPPSPFLSFCWGFLFSLTLIHAHTHHDHKDFTQQMCEALPFFDIKH